MNAIEKIDNTVEKIIETAKTYLGDEKTADLKKEYQSKKAETLVQVMLFGSYNAGKSSLINTLLGREAAEIGEIPKTAIPDRYDWNGCYLLDTPGVNAPIEHEAITQQQIDRSELILFVIRQGDQDVKDVYERMFQMITGGKHVFIVYNHELSGDDLQDAMTRLNDIMAQFAVTHSVELEVVGKIPVIPINIKTAFKSRVKGSAALAEHSGIVQFENAFQSWLRAFDDEYHYLDRLRKYVYHCFIEPALHAIAQKKTGETGQELKDLQYQRDELLRHYELIDTQVANHVRSEVNLRKPEIATLFSRSSSKAEIEAGIQRVAMEVTESTSVYLKDRCKGMIEELGRVVTPPVSVPDNDGAASVDGASLAVGELLTTGAKMIDEDLIKAGLEALSKTKIPIPPTVFTKVLGPLVQIVLVLVDVFTTSSAEEKQNAERRKQQLAAHQAIENAGSAVTSSILDETRRLISHTKQQAVAQIEAAISEITATSQQQVKDEETIKSLKTELESIEI